MQNQKSNKKRPEYYLMFEYSDGTTEQCSIYNLASRLGLKDRPTSIRLGMIRDGIDMHASLNTREADYPCIDVNASTKQAGDIALGNFELPNACYPSRISARLYAGCEKYETDEPIAITTHEVTDDARVIYRSEKYTENKMRKIVYVDDRDAVYRPWSAISEDDMPEHVEDEDV